MARFPIEQQLVPAGAPVAADALTRMTEPLTAGLPQRIVLDGDVSLVVTLPNGLALPWRDADPSALVSVSEPEVEPHAPDPNALVGSVARPPLRLLVLVHGAPVAAVPLAAGRRGVVPDGGGAVRIELQLLAWELRAGTLRGGGDFGSFLELAWRRADAGTDAFAPPPLNGMLMRRLVDPARLQSQVGADA